MGNDVSGESHGLGTSSDTNNESIPHDGDDQIGDLREKFHNTVRENIIVMLFFLTLGVISWTVIRAFHRKREQDGGPPSPSLDDDESVVYQICFWICVLSLDISIGATLLLPISIVSNEVLLLYPKTYYVQWLNGMLIQGLWNWIFLFANISLFILLPFAYLFIESEGFSGHKKGILAKFYETIVILTLSVFTVSGIAYALAAVLSPEKTGLNGLFILSFINQLPFIYSCISFFGVILLLICTPLGFARLFTVLSQLLVGPQFLRNLEEEVMSKRFEIQALQDNLDRKVEREKMVEDIGRERSRMQHKIVNGMGEEAQNGNSVLKFRDVVEEDETGSSILKSDEFMMRVNQVQSLLPQKQQPEEEEAVLRAKITVLEDELLILEKMKKTPGWKRNLLYPFAFLFVLVLTAVAVFMVILNTLQLLVGIKALPVSAQTISLGLTSMSVLGPWGAALEVVLIFYLISTSLIGLYNLPGVRRCRPRLGDSPTSHVIYNCALVLILSSALPLLARILGITNFDLLGNYGQIEWLGNFYIVVLYNILFSAASSLALVTKFTSAIRQEILKRLRNVFNFKIYPFTSRKPDEGLSYHHRDSTVVQKED